LLELHGKNETKSAGQLSSYVFAWWRSTVMMEKNDDESCRNHHKFTCLVAEHRDGKIMMMNYVENTTKSIPDPSHG